MDLLASNFKLSRFHSDHPIKGSRASDEIDVYTKVCPRQKFEVIVAARGFLVSPWDLLRYMYDDSAASVFNLAESSILDRTLQLCRR